VQKGTLSLHREMESPSEKVVWCEAKLAITDVLRFGYLGKWSPCAYESLSTKVGDYYLCTLLYDSNFTLT
jgi:hypothetical protein